MTPEVLRSIMEKLQPSDVDNLKYILRDNFTGKLC